MEAAHPCILEAHTSKNGPMNTTAFALFVLMSFALPIPILAWFDRSRARSDVEEE